MTNEVAVSTQVAEAKSKHGMSVEGLIGIAIGIVAFVVASGLLKGMMFTSLPTIWIQSGKTMIKAPLWKALRIVRKHQEWDYADVVPVERITRKQALKALFRFHKMPQLRVID